MAYHSPTISAGHSPSTSSSSFSPCTSGSVDRKTWVEYYQQPTISKRSYSTSGRESGFVLGYLFMSPSTYVTDAAGHSWTTGDIFESMAISAIYTMIFISILVLAILYRDQLTQKRVAA